MMNLTLVAQQLEIPLEQLKSICQVLKIEIVKNAVTPNDKQKIQEFIRVCKEKQISVEQGLQELEQFQKEAQTQQKVLGERFNLDEFFKQRIGTSPEQLNPGSYYHDLYQLLLKSQSISEVGYALFREAFLRQTQDLIMNGTEASSINQNQTVAGFDKAFDAVETQFEQNFLGYNFRKKMGRLIIERCRIHHELTCFKACPFFKAPSREIQSTGGRKNIPC